MTNMIDWDGYADALQQYASAERQEISGSTNLFSELGISSFDMIALVCTLEERFSIEIDLVGDQSVETAEDFYRYILLNSHPKLKANDCWHSSEAIQKACDSEGERRNGNEKEV